MTSAEIITIGTELLLGEIHDTNATYLARLLRDVGIDLYRKTTIGDNTRRIAQAIQEAMQRADIIITTGGLGPTVDDPTRDAVALAVGVEPEFLPELWEQIQKRFQRFGRPPTENNKRQAYVPKGAIPVENPVGTAPSFIVEAGGHVIFSLPGVPREMEYLMQHAVLPYLRKRYDLHGIIKARVLHTGGAGESQIDDLIGDLERLSNPTVGLLAHAGQVDIRITAKAESEVEADTMIHPIEEDIRRRLGQWVYGVDGETLAQVALNSLVKQGWTLAVVEAGLGGDLTGRLAAESGPFLGGEVLVTHPEPTELLDITNTYRQQRGADVGLGVALLGGPERQDVHMVLITPLGEQHFSRPYGGPPGNAPLWAVNNGLNLIRNL
jgi:competence/damage-inducible protein CinA-like protein